MHGNVPADITVLSVHVAVDPYRKRISLSLFVVVVVVLIIVKVKLPLA
jgi:hypothetical protein